MIKTSLQVGLVGLIIIFVWAMINSVDLAYQVAMLLFTLASLASLFWLQKKPSPELASTLEDHYLDGLVWTGADEATRQFLHLISAFLPFHACCSARNHFSNKPSKP